MGADNWAICPRCEKKQRAEHARSFRSKPHEGQFLAVEQLKHWQSYLVATGTAGPKTGPLILEVVMSREITSHKVDGLNDSLLVNVLDEPGQGNACHAYQVRKWVKDQEDVELCNVAFQDGPVAEFGVNGVSNEVLLAIVEDRLKGFQSGDFACRENALALTKIQEAMMWLHSRTRERISRQVEGTNQI